MKRFITYILLLFPVPFLFHFYEYNGHLAGTGTSFLFKIFSVFILIVGITSRNIKLPLYFGMNFIMIIMSLILGSFFIVDDGSWFKPFGRDVAIIFVSIVSIVGQLIIRGISKLILIARKNR